MYDRKDMGYIQGEENELNAEIAVEILSMFGLEVERACDGLEAVDFVEEREDGYYDIIFMDIQMPKLNGYDEDVDAAKTVGMNTLQSLWI